MRGLPPSSMHACTRAWFSQWRIHFFLLLPQVRQLTELGVTVTSTKPAIVKSNPYNEGYLRTKVREETRAFEWCRSACLKSCFVLTCAVKFSRADTFLYYPLISSSFCPPNLDRPPCAFNILSLSLSLSLSLFLSLSIHLSDSGWVLTSYFRVDTRRSGWRTRSSILTSRRETLEGRMVVHPRTERVRIHHRKEEREKETDDDNEMKRRNGNEKGGGGCCSVALLLTSWYPHVR